MKNVNPVFADTWNPYSWYCMNCGDVVTGYKRIDGTIKVSCPRCTTVMVRTFRGRRHDSLEVFAPKGMERVLRE